MHKFIENSCVSRWSGDNCEGKDIPVTLRGFTGDHDGLGFNDVSGLFLLVSIVILLCVITATLLFIVRCRQNHSSEDQAIHSGLYVGYSTYELATGV